MMAGHGRDGTSDACVRTVMKGQLSTSLDDGGQGAVRIGTLLTRNPVRPAWAVPGGPISRGGGGENGKQVLQNVPTSHQVRVVLGRIAQAVLRREEVQQAVGADLPRRLRGVARGLEGSGQHVTAPPRFAAFARMDGGAWNGVTLAGKRWPQSSL